MRLRNEWIRFGGSWGFDSGFLTARYFIYHARNLANHPPVNRIGFTVLSVAQLKILQEVITLTVFVSFALLYLKEPLKLDYLWAALCMVGAAYFMFRAR
ncbi:DMT family protein [Nitrosomonas sp.]|uniref:DMT family protein n=1 Tax=Nitrosomonas sp. TaxID=42353 RepID=UPI0025F5AE5C|nr:DMT family protein [Nitrosomonas sp.]